MKTCIRRAALLTLTAAMCLTGTLSTQAAEISNPRIKKAAGMKSGQKVTYDCVYFGNYPQAEVIGSKSAATTINEIIRNGQDYIVDADLYAKLKKAKKWDKNGDIVIGGKKYRRVKAENATDVYTDTYSVLYDRSYHWNDSYHYFKYQPIKWRVLYKTKDEMFLLADQALDCQEYNTELTSVTSVTWATSTVRSWLNGYGSGSNAQGISYKSSGFADIAFSKKQYNTILKGKVKNINNLYRDIPGGADTSDKIFLLAQKQVQTDSAKKYGFVTDRRIYDEARRSKSSSYAKAMGCCSRDDSIYAGNCSWWLRSPGDYADDAAYVDGDGWAYFGNCVDCHIYGVRPALIIDLTSSAQYKYAGTVCTDVTVTKAE